MTIHTPSHHAPSQLSALRGSAWKVGMMCAGAAVLLARATPGAAMKTRGDLLRASTADAGDSVLVTRAWARPALEGGTGGVYMTITNAGVRAIRVISAACTNAVATELHMTTVHDGMAHMAQLPNLVVTPGAPVSLAPGGMHFMLKGLHKALVTGDTLQLTLRLSTGHQIVVNAAVRVQ